MTTAFVLSGGASLGSVQVGMLRALLERGVRPDMVCGSSVGALNGAWLGLHPTLAGVERLGAIWRSVRRADVFPVHPPTALRGLAGRADHLVPGHGLEALLRRHLGGLRLEDARVPVHVVATEVLTGMEVCLSHGEAVPAVLASAAIPGVLPPVTIDGRTLVDGGVVDDTPIGQAVRLGATRVYVLPTGYACDLPAPPRSPLAMALHALTLLVEQRLVRDVETYERDVDLVVIPPLCPLDVSPADFRRTDDLIRRSHRESGAWLDGPRLRRGQRALLGFHRHAATGDRNGATPV